MIISLILGHPKEGSFNHAIAYTAMKALKTNGHIVNFHDLYKEKFDPILPKDEIPGDANLDPMIKKHCDEIKIAEGIIIVHPNWWGQPPAILKGWIDRVLRDGVAYQFEEGDSGEGVPIGLLQAKTAIIFNTSNTLSEREWTVFGDPLDMLWRKCVFELCGVQTIYRRMYGVMVTSTPEDRASWLEDVKNIIHKYFSN